VRGPWIHEWNGLGFHQHFRNGAFSGQQFLKKRPESVLFCLACAEFTRQRMTPLARVQEQTRSKQPPTLNQVCNRGEEAQGWPDSKFEEYEVSLQPQSLQGSLAHMKRPPPP